jgi:4-coumarate--CoA ligase
MIHESPFAPVDIPDSPLTEFVLRHADDLGDTPALIDGPSGRTLSYRQLDELTRSFAGGLVARGMGAGQVTALLAPNMPEYAVVFHGVARAGGTITTINPTYTPQEIRHQLTDSGARLLVTVGPFAETAAEAAGGTAVEWIVVIGDEVPGTEQFSALLDAPIEPVPVSTDTVVALPYSSGTTGLSKGVMLTHGNLVANVVQVTEAFNLARGDVLMAVLPFFHIYGMQVMMNCGLAVGATVVTMPRFDLEQFLQLHQEHRITHSFVAPPIVVALAKHPIVDNYDLSHLNLMMSGAAPLSAELALEAGARLNCEVVQGYGMTEMSPVSHLTPPGGCKPGSVGVTAPNTQTRIVDPTTGEDLGVNQDGEVWVKGPQVMAGYLNNAEATAATIDADGWLHTGDIGHIDEDGHLYVVDRLKELIKYKGFQVPPAELEALLLTHPAVADAAVVGRPDEEAGEVPIGFVVLKPDATATAEDIGDFVAERVATYKQLAEVRFIDAVPKSASGKILRRMLKTDDLGG